MALEKELRKNEDVGSSFAAYISKMKGEKHKESSLQFSESIVSAAGGLIAMTIVSVIAVSLGYPMTLGPIGASCLLIFSAHKGLFSQPRHVVGGHLVATISALTIWDLLGRSHFTIGMTLAVVIILMILTKTVHPPAAASAVVAINSQAGWGFLISVLICAVFLVFSSVLYNNLFPTRQYPKYWL